MKAVTAAKVETIQVTVTAVIPLIVVKGVTVAKAVSVVMDVIAFLDL